jgi:hypothetical protein
MPVEAALGDAKPTGERFHGDSSDALLGDQIKGGLGPVFGTEACRARGRSGRDGHGSIHFCI